MSKLFRLALIALVAFSVVGCRQDMHDQPKYSPLEPTEFFDNGSSSRQYVEGAVARHKGVPPYNETRDYVVLVLQSLLAAQEVCDGKVAGPRDRCVLDSLPRGRRR